ncbi:MAG: hypothetical protein HZC16_03240 [Candidatus Omnitrophica bacterium]|nr:hypothetical protein [Candidatus Omnitrophota bacterium]
MLLGLQHRGREASGIGAYSDSRGICVVKWEGDLRRFDLNDLYEIFPGDARIFFGHVRYATRGRKDKLLQDAHPHVTGGTVHEQGNHVIIENADAAIVHNGQVDDKYFQSVDASLLRTDCDSERLLHEFVNRGEEAVLRDVPGAYTCAVIRKGVGGYKAVRDRHGIKPGAIGFKDNRYLVASENCAITAVGGDFIENMRPGAVYHCDENGKFDKHRVVEPEKRHCFFEYTYLANKESLLDKVGVNDVRLDLAKTVARELTENGMADEIDTVTFIPRSPQNAARLLAEKLGKPLRRHFYKPRATRAFMGPSEEERRLSIQENLYLNPRYVGEIADRTILVYDDSTIRCNNATQAVILLSEYRPRKIIIANYTPEIGRAIDGVDHGCESGVDMPPNDNFVARGRNREEIAAEILTRANKYSDRPVDTALEIYYISENGFFETFRNLGLPKERLCHFCISGPRPF